MNDNDFRRLLDAARAAQANAYAPYSGFRVGAAILTASGAVYPGCNVENASFPAGLCAERGALAAAIAAGDRAIVSILIVADATEPCPPCGMCRQSLVEFGSGIEVTLVSSDGVRKDFELRDLLPDAFGATFFRR